MRPRMTRISVAFLLAAVAGAHACSSDEQQAGPDSGSGSGMCFYRCGDLGTETWGCQIADGAEVCDAQVDDSACANAIGIEAEFVDGCDGCDADCAPEWFQPPDS